MSEYIRVVYACQTGSRYAPEKTVPLIHGLYDQTWKMQRDAEVGSVMLCCDGFLMHCLEGEPHAVRSLYREICLSRYLCDPMMLYQMSVPTRLYPADSHKLVLPRTEVRIYLTEHWMEVFNPFWLKDEQIEMLLLYLGDVRGAQYRDATVRRMERPTTRLLERLQQGLRWLQWPVSQ
ncbi:BLUF domain-containing protein [Parathalassolituus penaei]|uniref:BLUF domain-containing protein n=1 Tax=Parathalassolituus penaei TaxID=2997323 RepID=A0A9X3ED43_9GAMM|nr:BLUF domain-containing protein [Parathalassolituus penaei]MCY0965402.1 BLUF domain-containing protein [Parathalassolituus penaei]